MEILIVAIIISCISIYGTIKLKRFYFMLGYFLFSILALTSLIPNFSDDPYLTITSLALFSVLGIISFPARKNIADYEINSEAMPLVKSFMLRTLSSLELARSWKFGNILIQLLKYGITVKTLVC